MAGVARDALRRQQIGGHQGRTGEIPVVARGDGGRFFLAVDQILARGADQIFVAAVAVEHDQFAKAVAHQADENVADDAEKDFAGQGQGTAECIVVVRTAEGQRRGDDHGEGVGGGLGGAFGDGGHQQSVGAHGHVRTMLFGGGNGQNGDRFGRYGVELLAGHFVKQDSHDSS